MSVTIAGIHPMVAFPECFINEWTFKGFVEAEGCA